MGIVDVGYVGGRRKRRTIYGRTQREVVRRIAEVKRDAAMGYTETATMTLEAWLTYWIGTVCPARVTGTGRSLKLSTMRDYESKVRLYLIPGLGKVRLDKLAPAHMYDLRAYIMDTLGKSTSTAHNAHRILSVALNDAVRAGVAMRNVAGIVPAPPVAEHAIDNLSLDEVAALLRAADGDRLQSRWAFALFTGARQGEALGLTWEHVNLETGVVSLAWQLQRIPYSHGCGDTPCGRKRGDRCPQAYVAAPANAGYRILHGNYVLTLPKTAKSRRLFPVPPMLLAALQQRHREYLAERHLYDVDYGLVWADLKGRAIDAKDDLKAWKAALRRAGLRETKLHTARHTAATILLELGIQEDVRMAIMGHSQAVTQRMYAHDGKLTQQRVAMATYEDAIAALLPGPGRTPGT